jgi:nicotinate-nucleotide adenylyltransferase
LKATGTSAPRRPPASADLRSLGILGGTFDPPHLGHLAIAQGARSELGLEQVVLMPALVPPHKPDLEDPGAEHRLRMCRLLVEGIEQLSVCALETERDGPSYTVDTLRAIAVSHPDAELTFIVGADTARTLPDWHHPRQVLELASLAVAARSGTDRRAVLDSVASLSDPVGVCFLETPLLELSSSLARERAAAGAPIDQIVGPAVAGYIAEHGLYRGSSQARS